MNVTMIQVIGIAAGMAAIVVAAAGIGASAVALAIGRRRIYRVEFRYRARRMGETGARMAHRVEFLPFIPGAMSRIQGLSDDEEISCRLASAGQTVQYDLRSRSHIVSFGYVNLSCKCPACKVSADTFDRLGPGWTVRTCEVPAHVLRDEAEARKAGADLPPGLEPFHLN